MYILMDIEWVEAGNRSEITQIAALRIDNQCKRMDEFVRRIRPSNSKGVQRSHMAYTGGTSQQFRSAMGFDCVMLEFRDWLDGAETILWWHESSENLFREKFQKRFGTEPPPMGVVRKLVREKLTDGAIKAGTPHVLCQARSLNAPQPEHFSKNDVEALRLIMVYAQAWPEDMIAAGCLEKIEYTPKAGLDHKGKGTGAKPQPVRPA